MPATPPLERHYVPKDLRDRIAYVFVRLMRFLADTFFARRHGHRAVVLETVAAVPGMVGVALQHFHSLRRIEGDHGMIRTLLDEAENERMHLMTFIHITQPSRLERLLIMLTQVGFVSFFLVIVAVRADEIRHREVNHELADALE